MTINKKKEIISSFGSCHGQVVSLQELGYLLQFWTENGLSDHMHDIRGITHPQSI